MHESDKPYLTIRYSDEISTYEQITPAQENRIAELAQNCNVQMTIRHVTWLNKPLLEITRIGDDLYIWFNPGQIFPKLADAYYSLRYEILTLIENWSKP